MHTDLLQYTGTVNITLGSKSRTYKNNGTSTLFRIFAQCLIDINEVGPINLPQEVMLKGLDANQQLVPALYASVKSTTKQLVTTASGGFGAKISLTILPTNISRADLENYQLCLLDGDNNMLAFIDIDDAFIPQIADGRQALIEWTLEVSNKEVR